jgi:hypothetical protein
MRWSLVVALVFACGGAASVMAADRVEKGTVLSVDPMRAVITDTTRKEETSLLDVNTFTVRRNETTTIELARQNPLVFEYVVTTSSTNTSEYEAALEFAKALQALLALFPESLGSDLEKPTIRGIDLDSFREDLLKVLEHIDRIGKDLAASLGTQEQIGELKKRYTDADIASLARRIEAAYAVLTRLIADCLRPEQTLRTDVGTTVSCDGPALLPENAKITVRRQALRDRRADLGRILVQIAEGRSLFDKTRQDLEDARTAKDQTKIKTLSEQIGKLEKAIASLLNRRDALENEIAAEQVRIDAELDKPGMRPTLIELAERAHALRSDITTHLTTLRAFAADVASLNESKPLRTVPHSVRRETTKVEIKASNKYDKFLDADTRKKRDARLRSFAIVLEPYQPAHLSVAPAFVLGFLKNPEFTAVQDGTTFRIQKKEEDLTRYTLGVMLNITPDAWQEPTFGGHFQVGVSPVKDAIGFFFGAGIRAQTVFSFGGGLMIQQVRRLADGLTLDSRLTSASELKTDHEFKPGLYLHITVSIPK